MKFRAILHDPGNLKQERAVQILSNSLDDVRKWAYGEDGKGGVIGSASSEEAVVVVYETIQTARFTWTKKSAWEWPTCK